MRAPSQRQGHPRHRPAMLRPELDTLAETLSTWPWLGTGPMLPRCGPARERQDPGPPLLVGYDDSADDTRADSHETRRGDAA
jgi:hypothetical protein